MKLRNIVIPLIGGLLFAGAVSSQAANLPPEVKTLRVNGYNMAYVERGQGVPLVLVHGSLSDYRTWTPIMEELAIGNRVIAVSLRHYFPERWDGKGTDLSLRQHADDVAAFIQALNVGPVHLLGHSRGGGVALLVAASHPEQIRSLMLADPQVPSPMLTKSAEVQAELDARSAVSAKILNAYDRGDTEGGLKVWAEHIAGPGAWERTPEKNRDVMRANQWTLKSFKQDRDTVLRCSDASRITAPALLITGERSASIYGYMHAAVRPCLKRVNEIRISDAGHLMFHANPTTFAFEIGDFVSQH